MSKLKRAMHKIQTSEVNNCDSRAAGNNAREETTGPHSEREIKGAVLITMAAQLTVLKQYQ